MKMNHFNRSCGRSSFSLNGVKCRHRGSRAGRFYGANVLSNGFLCGRYAGRLRLKEYVKK